MKSIIVDADRGERLHNVSLALLSGALLAAAYPPMPSGITAFVGFLPFFLLMDRMKSASQTFRYSYLAFLVLNLGTVYWISGWWGEDPWLKAAGVAVNLVHPLLFTLPALVFYRLRRRAGLGRALLAFPFVWTAWEWLFHLPELSFPWLLVGNTQTAAIGRIQFIEYTGVFGASFFVCLVNVLLMLLIADARSGRRFLGTGKARASLAALLMLFAGAHLHGALVLSGHAAEPGITVAIAQPNVDPYEKWTGRESPMTKVEHLLIMYDSAARGRPDLVLLPETAFPFLLRQPLYRAEYDTLRSRVDAAGVPLLTGFADLRWYDDSAAPASARSVPGSTIRYDTYNATMLLAPGSREEQVYHKSRLTPLSERIPYLDLLPFLQDALRWGVGISSWGLGNDTTVFTLPGEARSARLWSMICYETLYPSFVAGFVGRGANALAVVTNDGWFGNSSGPYQLEQYAALRAIETRRAIARCANNGISCFIDPCGRISSETAFGTRTVIRGRLPLRTDRTLFVRWGDWFAKGCLFAALLLCLWSEVSARRKKLKPQGTQR